MPYKRVIAIGDSFTRGDELADCPPHSEVDNCASTSVWPALLAKSSDVKYQSYALGGAGNQWISFYANCRAKQDALHVINWTWFERFDYVDPANNSWRTTHPRHEDKLNHYFYRNIDSDIWNLLRNLQIMHSTIQLLKQNNLQFIMTCLDRRYQSNAENETSGDVEWMSAILRLRHLVSPYIVDFEGMSFLEWSKYKQYPLGPNGHPLEKAHIEAAKYINTIITKESQNEH